MSVDCGVRRRRLSGKPGRYAPRESLRWPVLQALALAAAMLFLPGLTPTAFALSEKKEVEQGKVKHQQIMARFGLYKNPIIQAYVNRVGQRIVAESTRPDLEFTFTVLNDDLVNAFAVEGGFIYITRGIMSHMNSESELAAVLGHEVAHVTQKHILKAKTRTQVLNAVSQVAAIATGHYGIGELGVVTSDLWMKGYSRGNELEADEVGAEFMARAGYDPSAMLKTIDTLKNSDRLEIEMARREHREPAVYHGFLSTHPDNDKRYKEAIESASELADEFEEFVRVDEFVQQLNGLAYGRSRQIGVVRKNRFYHPKLGITLSFPADWQIESGNSGVAAVSQVRDAILTISSASLPRKAEPEKFVRDRLGMKIREGREVNIGGLRGYLGIADRFQSPFGPRPVRVVALFDDKRRKAYILTGAGKHDLRKIAADKQFITTIFSFAKMDKEDFARALVPRIQVVRAEEGTTMAELAAESPITNYAEQKLRLMNALYPAGEPAPGQLIKIVQ